MNQTLVRNLASRYEKKTAPVGVGQRVRVHQKIVEGEKERVQIFDGLVIKKRGGNSTDASFTVRKISEGVGVEKVFPLHSPSIVQIEILRQHKIRRSKLYFMRERFGKAARLKEDKSFDPKKAEEEQNKAREAAQENSKLKEDKKEVASNKEDTTRVDAGESLDQEKVEKKEVKDPSKESNAVDTATSDKKEEVKTSESSEVSSKEEKEEKAEEKNENGDAEEKEEKDK